jgi:hypothetical protein
MAIGDAALTKSGRGDSRASHLLNVTVRRLHRARVCSSDAPVVFALRSGAINDHIVDADGSAVISTCSPSRFRSRIFQRSDGWIETTWNNMSDPGAFAVAGAEEQEGGEPAPVAGAGVVVCLMA